MVMGEILFALAFLGAPTLADSDVHARVVPFFLANDIIRHCTLLWQILDAVPAGMMQYGPARLVGVL
jgi:hypothetical protein